MGGVGWGGVGWGGEWGGVGWGVGWGGVERGGGGIGGWVDGVCVCDKWGETGCDGWEKHLGIYHIG